MAELVNSANKVLFRHVTTNPNKNSSGDEIANVNFYAVLHGSYPNSLK